MDNVKDDRYYTNKMMMDLLYIKGKKSDQSFEDFSNNDLLQDIPWSDVFGLRNRIVHEYGGLVLKIVYDTLTQDIPDLIKKLSSLFPENSMERTGKSNGGRIGLCRAFLA